MDMYNDSSLLDTLRETLLPRLPVITAALIVMANGIFASMTLLPDWFIYSELAKAHQAAQAQLSAINQVQADEPELLEAQITTLETTIEELEATFLNPIQPDTIMNNLYINAQEAGISINRMIVLDADPSLAEEPYDRLVFQLETSGDTVVSLFNFLILMHETTIPSVAIHNLRLTEADDEGVEPFQLAFNLHMYTMPDVPATDFDQLTRYGVLTQPHTEVDNPLQPEIEPSMPIVDVTIADDTSLDTVQSDTNSGTSVPFCEGAPPTLLSAGTAGIVHFDGQGALRVLMDSRGGATSALMQLYDGAQVSILTGPLCGTWQGAPILYWYVDYGGNRGWVGEGSANEKWLCPVSQPKCEPLPPTIVTPSGAG